MSCVVLGELWLVFPVPHFPLSALTGQAEVLSCRGNSRQFWTLGSCGSCGSCGARESCSVNASSGKMGDRESDVERAKHGGAVRILGSMFSRLPTPSDEASAPKDSLSAQPHRPPGSSEKGETSGKARAGLNVGSEYSGHCSESNDRR